MNKYQIQKNITRDKATTQQLENNNKNLSYSELADFCTKFYKLGKKYGLLKEFKENGII